ncbi:MAG: FIST signal transduction protein [Myxococcaceae bacterium]
MSAPLPVIASSFSSAQSETEVAQELVTDALVRLKGAPLRGAVFSASVGYDAEVLRLKLANRLPGVPFLGATSCLGAASSAQPFKAGRGVGALWLAGAGYKFAVAAGPKGTDSRTLGAQLAERALAEIEKPRFLLMHSTPGEEEVLLEGIYSKVDRAVPVIGGSAADDDLSGKWAVWTHERAMTNGVALALCDWPWRFAINYQGGYLATENRGTVTRAEGRTLYEIDGRRAAVVYNEWLKGKLSHVVEAGGQILGDTTLTPLGIVRQAGKAEFYLLAHPERIVAPDKALTLFTQIKTGETVVQMKTLPAVLVERGASVASRAMIWSRLSPQDVTGALYVFCGGCLLSISDKASEMVQAFQRTLGPAPFLVQFGFGEQGCVIPGKPEHGNLMASVLLLSSLPEEVRPGAAPP